MSFFKRKSLFVLLIGIILLVILVGYSLANNNKSMIEKFISDSIGWLQNALYQPITYVVNSIEQIDDIKNTYNENKLLREKLAEYKTLVYDMQEIEKENKQLRKMLDLMESPRDYEAILATVIARSPERWIEQITINRGSLHGIENNMAVITGEGMIGKIKSVSNLTSTVQLLSSFDQLNRMSASIVKEDGNNIFGLIEGFDSEKEMLIFRVIDQSSENIQLNDIVISSSLGGMFPSGLLIGTIKELTPDQHGLSKIAYVQPAANLKEMNEVIVVKRTLEVVNDPNAIDVTEDEEDEEEVNDEAS